MTIWRNAPGGLVGDGGEQHSQLGEQLLVELERQSLVAHQVKVQDLLGLYEKADLLVTTDTATLLPVTAVPAQVSAKPRATESWADLVMP